MTINKQSIKTNLETDNIYGVDSVDGVYFLQPEKELKKGDVILYSHENTFDLLKVSAIGENFNSKLEEHWNNLYMKRTWGNVFANTEKIVSLRRQNHVQLTKSEDEEFDRKKHYNLLIDGNHVMVEMEGRLNKNQVVLIEGKVYQVSNVDNKQREVELVDFDNVLTKGLYSVDLKDGKVLLTDDWGEAFDARVLKNNQ